VNAWHHIYGLLVVLTNCSNNCGPWQLHEKLIPVVILLHVLNLAAESSDTDLMLELAYVEGGSGWWPLSTLVFEQA